MVKNQIDFKSIEKKWGKFWEKEKIYKFDSKSKKKIFSIDTPPPTVSGKMHIGHAFSYTQEDFIARFWRMKGLNVFYPFGTDDNGLATIRLIEKEKNIKGFDMGREEFVRLVLETLQKELRPKYIEDWKKLGMSCDWDIFYTTMDKHCQRISQRSFIQLYKMGREYRVEGPAIWCPECRTAIAQVEMNDEKKETNLVYIEVKTEDDENLTFATTRPELYPSCVGMSVNPNDKRYNKYVGKKVIMPLTNERITITSDEIVDPNYGTGIVYFCSSGDAQFWDWETRHPVKDKIYILNFDGTLNEKAGKYKGLTIEQTRKQVVKDLKGLGAIKKIEPILNSLNVHERCGTAVEYMVSKQWFIKYIDLKKEMLQWGRKLNWHPNHMRVRYDNWVKGLKWDWCISRQRFYGIPIPVWYCKRCNEVILPEEKQLPVDPLKDKPLKKCKCGSDEFIPERDVLDTWATSSLTPQITIELMPKSIQKKLYPMSLRPQAHDIITFWLFNTVVKNQLHYKKNPWKDIIISGFVLDPHRKKMSKSKGNVIEPQSVIEKYSADALRYWASSSKLGEDLSYQEKDIITGKKFVNKILNSSNFVFMNLKDYKPKKTKLMEMDRLFLSKLNETIGKCTKNFENYEYFKSKLESDNFFWKIFCDNYLEIVKKRVYNGNKKEKESAFYALYNSLLTILKLFAPITPFITEEIYQKHYRKNQKVKSIHVSSWPEKINLKKGKKDSDIFNLMIDTIGKVRHEKSLAKKPMNSEIILTLEKKDQEKLKEVIKDLKDVTNAKEIKTGKLKVEFV